MRRDLEIIALVLAHPAREPVADIDREPHRRALARPRLLEPCKLFRELQVPGPVILHGGVARSRHVSLLAREVARGAAPDAVQHRRDVGHAALADRVVHERELPVELQVLGVQLGDSEDEILRPLDRHGSLQRLGSD